MSSICVRININERARLKQAVLTLAAARPAWGAEGSLGQRPNVPGAGEMS